MGDEKMSRFQISNDKTHHRALTDAEEDAILAPFEKAAEAGQAVTVKEIKAAFDKVRGKDTGRGYIYMLLKRHGWRKVMPRSKHPKAANEEVCDASKKLNNLCLLVCDGAAWHKSKTLKVPENITLLGIPPYTPEMNPIEQNWNEMFLRWENCKAAQAESFELILFLCFAVGKGRLSSRVTLLRPAKPFRRA